MVQIGSSVLAKEANALHEISKSLYNSGFFDAVNLINSSDGHVIILGLGKSGHIGRKISASLSSTGTPSFFMHPTEAKHGDLGMLTSDDIVILISFSGKTEEIVNLMPTLKQRRIPIISITGDDKSPLALNADICLSFKIEKEACSFNIVPTVSTSATLALGDALAIALMELKGFSDKDFSKNHPSGSLGKSLTTLVSDIVVTMEDSPYVYPETSLIDALVILAEKKYGFIVIINDKGLPLGLLSDGDIKEIIKQSPDLAETNVSQFMKKTIKTVSQNTLASKAADYMRRNRITALVAVDKSSMFFGVSNIKVLEEHGF
ncbi:arabinose 5-phosphate isomerase [bacterium endosymbiont of Mortierella elongata FMR23-6]|nr:arabinose 5-phosphate isomerase [bacterium endosymbiont of Mortierella elongata FMR23-6]